MTSCEGMPTTCSLRRTCARSFAATRSCSSAAFRRSGSRTPWDGAGNLHWYDYAVCVVYLSYFVATYLVAGFLWFSARSLFRRYVAMVVIALMGFATYALFPAAPPWLASHYGGSTPQRSIAVIWEQSRRPRQHVFEEGTQYANPVAAVPSLHAAYTLLITLILWRPAPP